MKSAIGIGALLADGLGDTIRVSLTEDPEFELEPCRTLAQLGDEAVSDANRQKAQNVIAFDDSETRAHYLVHEERSHARTLDLH